MHPNDPFAHADDRARKWLAVVGDQLGTEPRRSADRGPSAATPGVPGRPDVPGFTARFAGAAGVTLTEVPPAAAAVTAALDRLCSPGQLGHVMKLMPSRLAELLTGDRRAH
ncbi:hypothetical protein [Amycolatopsis tolypomycina]|uniref:Uncharacterized protein n=1 Tax=Amycolatopsis tolypomycina TaxID=208445 RepID=A0A1H4U6Z8_9PSEU|nr:hypothetical protein [Amycolatopsis tolypomycina]SEC64522.1 hypothetical protein SAMN04489727_4523 [Amycolatopsis tolypomycina]